MSTLHNNEKGNVAEMVDNAASSHHDEHIHVVRRVHADGAVDLIDAKAVGGDIDEMPKGYYYSLNFICTFLVRTPLTTLNSAQH